MLTPEKELERLEWIESQAVSIYRQTGKPPTPATQRLWMRMTYDPSEAQRRIRQAIRREQGLLDDSAAEVMRSVEGNENLTFEEWKAACDKLVELVGDCEPLDVYAKPEWLELDDDV